MNTRKIMLPVCAGLAMATAAQAQPTDITADDASDQDPIVIEQIVVVGTDQDRYRVGDSGALTGFPLDFLELPRVVNVIPEQLVLDQKITDLGEALRNTPGITQSDGFGGTNDDFYIRGFRRNTVYRNGFRRATNLRTNLTNAEYIQVIRGPASITYGQVEPGGLVDVVTKKPLDEQRIAGEARFGSYSDRLFLLDWSQPISEAVGIRVVASTQDAHSFRDFTNIARDTIAISGRFDLTSTTRVDISYEYRDESRPLDRGTLTVRTPEGREIVNNLIDIPISRRFGEPFEIAETEFHFVESTIEQQIGDNWQLRIGGAYEESLGNDLQARPRGVVILNQGAPISPDGFFTGPVVPEPFFDDPTDLVFLARRTDGSRQRKTEVVYLNGFVTGEFETGSIKHRIAIGGDFRRFKQTRFFVSTPTTNGIPVELGGNGPLFDLRNPIYGNLPDMLSTDGRPLLLSIEKTYGFFINDYIDITDRLSLLVGVRYDGVKGGNGFISFNTADAVSPQAAVNFRFTDNASVFFSYSQAFEPNFVADPELGPTEPFDPEDSEQFEVGAKAEFADGRLQITGALFRINKKNVLTVEDGIPVLRPGQNAQGIELSVAGQPVPGMNVVAGLAYTDATLELGANAGNRPRNVAKTTINLWMSYEWQSGMLEGLGVGGGVFHTSNRFGDDANTWSLGSYTLVDLSVWYTLQIPNFGADNNIRLQVAVKNLFDEVYYPASGGNERVNLGTPRTVFGSVSFDF